MKRPRGARTVEVQALMNRKVVDAQGKRIGRVSDLLAQRRGDDLCVTHLLVGSRALLERLGWGSEDHAHHIAWEDVADLGPPIRLRDGRR